MNAPFLFFVLFFPHVPFVAVPHSQPCLAVSLKVQPDIGHLQVGSTDIVIATLWSLWMCSCEEQEKFYFSEKIFTYREKMVGVGQQKQPEVKAEIIIFPIKISRVFFLSRNTKQFPLTKIWQSSGGKRH